MLLTWLLFLVLIIALIQEHPHLRLLREWHHRSSDDFSHNQSILFITFGAWNQEKKWIEMVDDDGLSSSPKAVVQTPYPHCLLHSLTSHLVHSTMYVLNMRPIDGLFFFVPVRIWIWTNKNSLPFFALLSSNKKKILIAHFSYREPPSTFTFGLRSIWMRRPFRRTHCSFLFFPSHYLFYFSCLFCCVFLSWSLL